MKYTLGKYTFSPEQPFNNYNDAVQWIQERHPELLESSIRKRLIPKIEEDESVKSGGSGKEPEQSNSSNPGTRQKGNKPDRASES